MTHGTMDAGGGIHTMIRSSVGQHTHGSMPDTITRVSGTIIRGISGMAIVVDTPAGGRMALLARLEIPEEVGTHAL